MVYIRQFLDLNASKKKSKANLLFKNVDVFLSMKRKEIMRDQKRKGSLISLGYFKGTKLATLADPFTRYNNSTITLFVLSAFTRIPQLLSMNLLKRIPE